MVNSFNEEYVNVFGRSYIENNELALHHGGNAIEVGIIGTSLSVALKTDQISYMRVWVDGVEYGERITINSSKTYKVAENLEPGYHIIRIVKATEMQSAAWKISSFYADRFASVPEKSELKIEYIGDSITAGQGALGPSSDGLSVTNGDPTRAYAYYSAQKLNAEFSIISWGGISVKAYVWAKTINMVSLYPKIAVNKWDYAFDFNPDVVVLNLGTNDAVNLLPSYEGPEYANQFPIDYKELLQFIRDKNPTAHIICLYGMLGINGTIEKGIQTAISRMEDDNIVYNPFDIRMDNVGAGGHPCAEAQEKWADLLNSYINSLMIARTC